MKLAALQLMQQKANKETPSSLENGGPPSSAEADSEDSVGPEAGSEEEGSSVSGLAKVKELAETIASDDGTGGDAVLVWDSPSWSWQLSHGWLMTSERAVGPEAHSSTALPPILTHFHSRPSKPRGDSKCLQGCWLHQQHGL